MIIEEFDHLIGLSTSPQDSVMRYQDTNALNDRIAEWFETPEGSIADLPSWGNPLAAFKHEPQSVTLEVIMEMMIIGKLAVDCGVPISGIRVDFIDVDMIRVQISYYGGLFNSGVRLYDF